MPVRPPAFANSQAFRQTFSALALDRVGAGKAGESLLEDLVLLFEDEDPRRSASGKTRGSLLRGSWSPVEAERRGALRLLGIF